MISLGLKVENIRALSDARRRERRRLELYVAPSSTTIVCPEKRVLARINTVYRRLGLSA
jgi:hypothetical protein